MATRTSRNSILLLVSLAMALLSLAAAAATDAELRRDRDEKASKQVIQRLFAACPGAKAMLRASEGYATFADVGAGSGSGVARPTRTRTPVYMSFESTDAALNKRDLVFVFATRDDFSRFLVQGATLGGQATAGEGGDCSQALAPGVRVIQIEGKRVVGGTVPTARYSKASLN